MSQRQRALAILALAMVLSMTTWFSASAVLPTLRALWQLDLPTYEPGAGTCPRCVAGDPLHAPGSTGTGTAAGA